MQFRKKGRTRGATEVNMTPLIDIVFQLLIFFLITTTFVQNPGIEVSLPKASSAPVTTETEMVIVAVTKDGGIIHEGKLVSVTELEARLKEHHRQRANATVIVQADTDTPHGNVVQVMDIARSIGFAQLAIATEAGM